MSGGCDSLVKIWREGEDGRWLEVREVLDCRGARTLSQECKLEAHSDWVRDTAWAPSLGPARQTLASCSQDRRVIIWSQKEVSTLHAARCTLHAARCTLHAARCTLHTAHCTLHTAHCTLHTAHCTLHTACRKGSKGGKYSLGWIKVTCPRYNR